jgi:hypothetical protein
MPKATPFPKKQAPSKTVAKVENKSVSTVVHNFKEDAQSISHNMKMDDMAIPRLVILQSLSPQCQKGQPGYIKGAESGQLFNSVTGELFDGEKGVNVIPVAYRKTHIEWTPRAKGGGFVKDHGPDGGILEATTKDPNTGRNILQGGNEITISAEYYIFLLDDEGNLDGSLMLSMSGTQLKKSRKWNSLINALQVPDGETGGTFNPAMFYKSYKLTTTPEKNDKGSWMGWVITPDDDVMDIPNGMALYQMAKEFNAKVREGKIKAAAPIADQEQGSSHDDSSSM